MHRLRSVTLHYLAIAGLALFTGVSFGQEVQSDSQVGWVNNYEQAQTEQLIDQGMAALELNDFEAAEKSFARAMQVVKVNNGLHSLLQIPALELLIESQIAQGRWQMADQQMAYFQWLNSRAFYQSFQDYLKGTASLSRLLLSASANVNNPASGRYLVTAKNLNWRAISAIQTTLGEDSMELVPWLYDVVLAHHYQSSLTKRRGLTSYDFKTDNREIINGWTLRKNESLRINHAIGKELLERIRGIYAKAKKPSAESDALLAVYQGDWEMLFGNNSSALEYYEEAYAGFIAANIDPDHINQFFEQTVVLPVAELESSLTDAMPAEDGDKEQLQFIAWSPIYLATAVPNSQYQNRTYRTPEYRALVTFNLVPLRSRNSNKNISDNRIIPVLSSLQIQETSPDNGFVRDLARHEISLLHFRPRFRDGLPVSRENIKMEYLFSSQISPLTLTNNEL